MAISGKFAKMMGGDIQLQSKLNEGSRFIVNIPLKRPPVEADIPVIDDYTPNIDSLQNIRVLLAEDNEINSEKMCIRDRGGSDRHLYCRYIIQRQESDRQINRCV